MFEGLMQPMHLLVILVIALLFFGRGQAGNRAGQGAGATAYGISRMR